MPMDIAVIFVLYYVTTKHCLGKVTWIPCAHEDLNASISVQFNLGT